MNCIPRLSADRLRRAPGPLPGAVPGLRGHVCALPCVHAQRFSPHHVRPVPRVQDTGHVYASRRRAISSGAGASRYSTNPSRTVRDVTSHKTSATRTGQGRTKPAPPANICVPAVTVSVRICPIKVARALQRAFSGCQLRVALQSLPSRRKKATGGSCILTCLLHRGRRGPPKDLCVRPRAQRVTLPSVVTLRNPLLQDPGAENPGANRTQDGRQG